MKHACCALLASVSFLPFSAAAEEAVAVMPPVVVTATRTELPLNQIASSMTVIPFEQIQRRNRADVAELLREVPGITVASNGGAGQTTRVFMRGTNSNHVLVLLDGVIVNDPSDPGNAFDFANLSTDNVERIEILSGPQSTLYGSEAIGGVIHIISRKGRGQPRSTAFAEYGRYGTARSGAGHSGEIGRTAYSFSVSGRHTDGVSALDTRYGGTEKDRSNSYYFSGNVHSALSDAFTAKLATRYSRVNTAFDSPGAFTRPADDPLADNDTRQFTARAAGQLALMDGRWVQELGVSALQLNRSQITVFYDTLGNELFGRQQQLGRREMADWVHHIRAVPGHVFSLGAETRSDHFKPSGLGDVTLDNHALYASDQFGIGDAFFMNASTRADFNQAFGNAYTWKLAPGYRIPATDTTVKASYGTGFKTPSLSQLYDPIYGNAALNPERSRGWDAGFEQALWKDRLTVSATYFRNSIRQLIGNANTPPFATLNTGKAKTQGVESSFTYRPAKDWALNGSYTYTLSQDRARDRDLLRRPRHMATAGARYQATPDWDMALDARYSSTRKDIDIQFPYGLVRVKSFALLDLSTHYRVTQAVTLYGRIENLLDKRYEEVFGYGAPGMALYAGAKLAY